MNYRDKIYEILKILEDKHLDLYFSVSKEETLKYIDEVLNKFEIKDKYDFYYVVNVIIKKISGIYDSHTKLLFKDNSRTIPIRLKYINNKLYIIRTDAYNEDLLYSEVLKINGVDVSKLIEEIENMTPYSTKEYLISPIEVSLRTINKLKALPSIDNSCEEYEIEVLKDNQIIKRTLKELESYDDLIKVNERKNNYSYEIMDDKIYLVYNACKEEYEGQMKEFVNQIKELSETNNINKFIVDLRGNAGGNSDVINPLIDYLNGKEIITLIDEYVFSGGRWAVFDLKNIGSKFVGTGIGTSMNCFGNISKTEMDDFILAVSNKYWYFDKDCNKENFRFAIRNEEVTEETLSNPFFIPFEEMKKHKKYFISQIFEPDYYVVNSIDAYKNNEDRQLYAAESLLDLKKGNSLEEFKNIKTPDGLMKFMDDYIIYGWIGNDLKLHVNSLDNFREQYRTSSIEDIILTGLGTCIGQAKLIKFFFDKMGIENKLYCHRSYEIGDNSEKKIKMHCFVLFKSNDKWYHFEHSMYPMKGIHEYNSLEEALEYITSKWPKGERQLTEIDSIPDGLTYKEFNEYVNSFDNNKTK